MNNLQLVSVAKFKLYGSLGYSHYDNLPSLFYLAFVQRKLSIDDGVMFVKNKLDRSYNKMSSKSREYYKNKREMVLAILK